MGKRALGDAEQAHALDQIVSLLLQALCGCRAFFNEGRILLSQLLQLGPPLGQPG